MASKGKRKRSLSEGHEAHRTATSVHGDATSAQYGSYNNQLNAHSISFYAPSNDLFDLIPPFSRASTIGLPFLRDPAFIERKELHMVWQTLASAPRAAIIGIGGIGKTQIALEYCYRLRDERSDTWVLWLNASSSARLDNDMRDLAHDLGLVKASAQEINAYQLVATWLRSSTREWLIVLDSIDDPDVLQQSPELSRRTSKGKDARNKRPRIDYFPNVEHGRMLITTRTRTVADRFVDPCNQILLEPATAHAIALCQARLPAMSTSEAATFVAALDCIPLAISQASAYIRKLGCTPAEYLARFEESDYTKELLLSNEFEELRRDVREASHSVLKTWRISFEHIRKQRRSAADTLGLMSLYDHQKIPACLLAERTESKLSSMRQSDSIDWDTAVLKDFSFIVQDSWRATFAMHRLVQLAVQVWLREQGEYESCASEAILKLHKVFATPQGLFESELLQNLEPKQMRIPRGNFPSDTAFHDHATKGECYIHVRRAARIMVASQEVALLQAELLKDAAEYALTECLYAEAETLATNAMRVRIDDSVTFSCFVVLAEIRKYQNRHDEQRRFLEIARQGFASLPRTVDGKVMYIDMLLNGLACRNDGEDDSERTARNWSHRIEASHGKDHPLALYADVWLIDILLSKDGHATARSLVDSVLARCEQALGPEHRYTLRARARLAMIQTKLGEYAEARESMRECAKVSSRPESAVGKADKTLYADALQKLERLEKEDVDADTLTVVPTAETRLGHVPTSQLTTKTIPRAP